VRVPPLGSTVPVGDGVGLAKGTGVQTTPLLAQIVGVAAGVSVGVALGEEPAAVVGEGVTDGVGEGAGVDVAAAPTVTCAVPSEPGA
jgi:hypothetical protein